MGHFVYAASVSLGLFAGILLLWEAGRRIALARRSSDPDAEKEGFGAVEGAVFGLMGLILAFSFSGAMTRWDERRSLVVEEANDIGTAWLRIDALPASAQPEMRELFRRYLDARIATYKAIPDMDAVRAQLARGSALQSDIWRRAIAVCLTPEGERARLLLLPALNAMIDITTTRTMAAQLHPPRVVFVMLFGMALAASPLAGYGMTGGKLRSRFHMLGFALVMAIAVFVILDIEYPRLGWIRIDAFDQALVDLRESMNREAPAPKPK